MKEFINEVIRQIEYLKKNDNLAIKNNKGQLELLYNKLTIEDKKKVINIIGANDQENIYILSFLLKILKDETILFAIEDILEDDKMITPIDCFNIIYQLHSFLFINPIIYNEKQYYKRINKIFTNKINELCESLEIKEKKVLLKDRNQKKVIFMVREILNERHAPTAKIANLTNYYNKLGYEVLIISCYQGKIQYNRGTQWYNSVIENNLFLSTGRFKLNYFGIEMNGININYSDGNIFYSQLLETIKIIKDYNPLFILDVGGNNPVASICTKFTSVVSMACINKPPITSSNLIARYFRCTESESELYNVYENNKVKVFDMIHYDEYGATEGKCLSRKDIKIGDEKFVILIAGNRLDKEINDEFFDIIQTIIKKYSEVVFVFIGKCNELKGKMYENIKNGTAFFTGDVTNFKEIMKIGNLFLNPPRKGGGTGAFYAISNNVPVLTLPQCDVAQVGDQFCCGSLSEMVKIVGKYINDITFYEAQKSLCRKAYDIIYGVDNLENINKFIEKMKKYIQEKGNI